MANRLDQKVAMVTGAATGIGRASARMFARDGARVVVTDIDQEGGEETARQIVAEGGEAFFQFLDVSKADQVEAAVAAAVERYGSLDCAHNNAGIGGEFGNGAADASEESLARVVAVNMLGTRLCLKYEIRQMLKQGRGSIVNTASITAVRGVPLAGDYVASKHAVLGYTRSAAIEYARRGIRVNAVCPTMVQTAMADMIRELAPDELDKMIAACPIGRIATADEVAEAVVWLSSDAASYITGHPLMVDGGAFAG